jgi:hypothetical protein
MYFLQNIYTIIVVLGNNLSFFYSTKPPLASSAPPDSEYGSESIPVLSCVETGHYSIWAPTGGLQIGHYVHLGCNFDLIFLVIAIQLLPAHPPYFTQRHHSPTPAHSPEARGRRRLSA